MKSPEFAISLGGSVIMPDCIVNTKYLLGLADLLKKRTQKAHQISVIVTGGGPLSRQYQNLLRAAGNPDKKTQDKVGIIPTHSNAKLIAEFLIVRGINASYTPYLKKNLSDTPVWVTGGTKPEQSTDAVAVDWAVILGFTQVINITNTPFVFEFCSDGVTPDTTKPISEMTHDEYLALVGPDHIPGENVPAGRTGIKIAKKYGVVFHVVGPDLNNLKKVFEGKKFKGTTIRS